MSVETDNTLLEKFTTAVNVLDIDAFQQTVEEVDKMLLWKMYNARCNEFYGLQLNLCIQEKNVDASIGLRDKSKVYAFHFQ